MAIKTYRDGRVMLTGANYRTLRHLKWSYQRGKCADPPDGCGKAISLQYMELHHIYGRGMSGGKRDDTLKATIGLCKKCHQAITPKPMWRKRNG